MARDLAIVKGLSGVRYALRRFLAASEVLSRAAGVTQQQYQVMLAIRACEGGAISMKELAEQLLLTPHAAVQMIDRLSAAELAERRHSKEDRRIVRVSLTRKGARLIDELAARHFEELLDQEPRLSRSLAQLTRLARS
ncbi:MAG: MarR family transcriptional regulator [Caulobacteraceae bacterium]